MTRVPHYDETVEALQVVTALWMLLWALRSLRRIAQGDARTIQFIQLMHFFFCGIPLVLDILLGPPIYPFQWGFIISQTDATTNYVYLAYIAAIPVLLQVFGGPWRPIPAGDAEHATLNVRRWTRLLAWLFVIMLPVAVALSPRPSMYLQYAAVLHAEKTDDTLFQPLIAFLALAAVIASVIIVAARDSRAIERILVIPGLTLALWVHGKRSVVALGILLLLYLLWMRGALRGVRFLAAVFSAGLLVAGFSYLYQTRVRDLGEANDGMDGIAESDLYVSYRIDFGRDAVMKQTLFAELYPEKLHILDYRGQSLMFDAAFFVPRRLWPNKPYPYAVYVTAAMLRTPPGTYDWGVTTSWLEEAIANFGWLGMILGPLIPARICAIGDRKRTPVRALLTVSVAAFFLVVQLIAFLPLFAGWVIVVITGARRRARALSPAAATPRARLAT